MFNKKGEKIEVYAKDRFSERKGIKKFYEVVQINNLNQRTRNKLYTATEETFNIIKKVREYADYFVEILYTEIYSQTKGEIPINYSGDYYYSDVFKGILDIMSTYKYNEIFDFVEGFIKVFGMIDRTSYNRYNLKDLYIDWINDIFEKENVNYRIVNETITDIVDEEKIKSIDETLNSPHDIVRKHYNKALEKLYKDKDYSNSIKESISSVEAMCQIINGSKETLGKALNNLKIEIHPALKSAYSSLYGYTSDENGTRHANGIGEKNATFEEAKYMLISCSAFVNYLKENFEKEE